jgi:Protein of unknown function (DUF1697)
MLGRAGLDRANLLEAVERCGGRNARSHLATGNVTFDAPARAAPGVGRRLESAVSAIVERPTMVALRRQDWLRELVSVDPFVGFEPDEWEFEVSFLSLAVPPLDPGSLPPGGRTVVLAVLERELVTARPRTGVGRPHVNGLMERATGQRATARGWSTLLRLAADGA